MCRSCNHARLAGILLLGAVLAVPVRTARAQGADPAAENARLERIAEQNRAANRARFTPADARFMTQMIGHHAQAIVMSRLAPSRAASPAVRTLAARIINAQADEIAAMQQWLRERGQPVPDPDAPMDHSAMDHGAMDHGAMRHGEHGAQGGGEGTGLMAGMLTPAELDALAAATGPAFDRLFLTSMIRHHQGATSMVKTLFATDGAAQDVTVFKFASDVNVDQTTEIARMERMLAALPPAAGQ